MHFALAYNSAIDVLKLLFKNITTMESDNLTNLTSTTTDDGNETHEKGEGFEGGILSGHGLLSSPLSLFLIQVNYLKCFKNFIEK